MTTIKDIAKACGVSTQAVSHALNNQGRLSETRRKQIIDKARELRYYPNSSARRMQSGKTGAVGLLYARKGFPVPSSLLDALVEKLEEAGLDLKLYRLPESQLAPDEEAPRVLREIGTDAFLVMDLDPENESLRRLIRTHRVPTVWINEPQESDAICPNDRAAAEDATRELIEQGLERIVYLDFHYDDRPHYSIAHRRSGYARAMQAAGRQPEIHTLPLFSQGFDELHQDPRLPALERVFHNEKGPVGVISYNELSVSPTVFMAERHGLQTGRDLFVHTFYGTRLPNLAAPVVVHCIPYRRMGELAVARALELIEGKPEPQARVMVDYESTLR